MTWTPKTKQTEVWSGETVAAKTWTPATEQGETWSEKVFATRVFDPAVYDNKPVYDTGSYAGFWRDATMQPEIWTPVT